MRSLQDGGQLRDCKGVFVDRLEVFICSANRGEPSFYYLYWL